MDARAARLIEALQLVPHPEGGFYRETYRSAARVNPGDGRSFRPALTTIDFLLTEGACSRWHRVRSDEVWHFSEGAPLELLVVPPALLSVERVLLGPWSDMTVPVYTVPAGWWQAARPRGTYAFVGCTVAPGFDFEDFSFLRDDPSAVSRLTALGAEWAGLV